MKKEDIIKALTFRINTLEKTIECFKKEVAGPPKSYEELLLNKLTRENEARLEEISMLRDWIIQDELA